MNESKPCDAVIGRPKNRDAVPLKALADRCRKREWPTLVWVDQGQVRDASWGQPIARAVFSQSIDMVAGIFDEKVRVPDLRHALSAFPELNR